METTSGVWYAYASVAGLMLVLKLVRFVYFHKDYNDTFGGSLGKWFFERSLENAASWVGTIVVVWMLGYLFISKVVEPSQILGGEFAKIPVAIPVGAFAGYLAEKFAPDFMKWIAAKIKAKLT